MAPTNEIFNDPSEINYFNFNNQNGSLKNRLLSRAPEIMKKVFSSSEKKTDEEEEFFKILDSSTNTINHNGIFNLSDSKSTSTNSNLNIGMTQNINKDQNNTNNINIKFEQNEIFDENCNDFDINEPPHFSRRKRERNFNYQINQNIEEGKFLIK